MAKIYITELERDEQPISDIWAVIQMQLETNLDVQFQLELLIEDWVVEKLHSYAGKKAIERWREIARKNNFEFSIEEHLK